MSKVSTSDFTKGMFILFRDEPHQIVDLTFVNPGKGSAFVRTKLKSIKTGNVNEFTYKSGEMAQEYPVFTQEMQYLYKQGEEYIFMDPSSYEQMGLAATLAGDFAQFFKEGDTYQILVHDNAAIGMRTPKKVRLKVISAEDAVKGSTVSGAKKMVTLETGATVAVPLFIKEGDTIAIDPENGQYIERVGQI